MPASYLVKQPFKRVPTGLRPFAVYDTDAMRIPRKSPLRTEMISSLDSDIVSPPGPVSLAIGSLALSRLSSIVLLI